MVWYGVKGHALDECSKRLLVAQREMNDTLVATSSRLDTTNDRLGALEERADRTDAALINIQDIEADITTIKGQVERLLNWKPNTEKRLSKNDDELSQFDKALKEHTEALQKKIDTQLLQHQTTLTTYDKALIAAKVIPRSQLTRSAPVEEATDVHHMSQTSLPPRNKRDGASSFSVAVTSDNRPRKR